MIRILGSVVAAMLVLGGTTAYACEAHNETKAKAEVKTVKAGDQSKCRDMFAKLNLTDEQKEKLATLSADCDKVQCTTTSKAKFAKGLKTILTVEQLAKCQTECEKAGDKDCPLMAASSKPDAKK